MDVSGRLIEGLLKPQAYAHSTDSIRLVETHCAWVFLTGEFAYKVKKPVDFGFLDFSTLEKRRFFCEEEVRLNRRFAPELYLGVVAITGQPDEPRIAGSGPVIEYAVHMRQFPDDGLLSLLAERHRLGYPLIDQMIANIAEFHQTTARAAPDSDFGDAAHIHHWVTENFEHIRPALDTDKDIERLDRIQRWAEDQRARLDALFRRRKQGGFIRECHGDLHLGNLTLIEGKVTLFDCIEFNPELRWIDVISEVAFLVMDLDDRGYSNFAHRFLNGYLQQTGDYEGLGVLRYYLVYRAMVRAKVAMLRRQQATAGSDDFDRASADYSQYMQLAERYIEPRRPVLLITHGLSGSGKTTVAARLCESAGMIQIRSDIERKRMAGLRAAEPSASGIDEGLYARERTEQTYQRLAQLAGTVLESGYSVIADATFLQRKHRDLLRSLARQLEVPFLILDCTAPVSALKARIQSRQAARADASEATVQVLEAQQQTLQPLDQQESEQAITIDTGAADWIEALQEAVRGRFADGGV